MTVEMATEIVQDFKDELRTELDNFAKVNVYRKMIIWEERIIREDDIDVRMLGYTLQGMRNDLQLVIIGGMK